MADNSDHKREESWSSSLSDDEQAVDLTESSCEMDSFRTSLTMLDTTVSRVIQGVKVMLDERDKICSEELKKASEEEFKRDDERSQYITCKLDAISGSMRAMYEMFAQEQTLRRSALEQQKPSFSFFSVSQSFGLDLAFKILQGATMVSIIWFVWGQSRFKYSGK